MKQQRTPLRSRSSLANPPTISQLSSPQQSLPRVNLTDLRRPPSSRSLRPSSPRASNSSRPGSAMSNRGSSSSSRPSTPSSVRYQEPYTGSITVSIRPNPHSIQNSHPIAWEVDQNSNSITNTNDLSSFSFDNVFPLDLSLSNREVYNRACSHIVLSFLNEGYNGTVFAYGMTGSGKTFSMRGDENDPGFVKLAIDDIFQKINNDNMLKQYSVSVTYLEIYNEKIIDLLNETSGSISQDLKIRDDATFGTKIVGINCPTISSQQQLLELIKKGDIKRKTGATDFNARSSRSHSILQIKLSTIDLITKLEQNSTLSLCDLAGSEKATSSIERRKEGAFINKSLLALSTVINKLSLASYGGSPSTTDHIPYRDSKLTRLLQLALSGSSLILILCTVHIGSSNTSSNQHFISETYNTLRFAARAKDIVMHVNTNKKNALSDAESHKIIEELKMTIDAQKNEINMLKLYGSNKRSLSGCSISLNSGTNSVIMVEKDVKIAQLEAEIKILNEKLEHFSRLTDLQKTETVLLRNDALNDLLGMGVDNNSLQIMMSNLEDFYKRINYELDEHKAYINHLENQLKISHQQLALSSSNNQINEERPTDIRSSSSSISSSRLAQRKSSNELKQYSDRHIEAVLRDQEEEIWHLKELLKDKDHIINGITKTSKLRRLVDSTSVNSQITSLSSNIKSQAPRVGAVTPPLTARSDKENSNFDLKDFKISPKRPLYN